MQKVKKMKHARQPWRRLAVWTAVLSLLGALFFPFAPPALAGSAPQVTKIGSGCASSSGYAVKSDGTAWAWGDNSYGALGNNSTTYSSVAVQVLTGPASPLTGITAIAGGGYTGYAVKSDGTAWAWGINANGALGNNSIPPSSVAVQVLTGPATPLTGITAIAGGRLGGYALDNQGRVWAWGGNSNGQLGNNSTTDSSVAVQVYRDAAGDPLTGITAIARGGYTGYATTRARSGPGVEVNWGTTPPPIACLPCGRPK